MNITLTPGLLEWTLASGETGYINLTNSTKVNVETSYVYTFREAVASPDPYAGSDPTKTATYEVWVSTIGLVDLRIKMGKVANQSSWLNTLAGANIAAAAISASFPPA